MKAKGWSISNAIENSIPTINAPPYQHPQQYGQHYNDPLLDSTPVIRHQSSPSSSEDEEPLPLYIRDHSMITLGEKLLLSAGQSMAMLKLIFGENDPVFGYQLGRSGAFDIKGLTLNNNAVERNGAYVMEGKYYDMYSGDFNVFESNSPPSSFYSIVKKFTLNDGYLCYMAVNPQCKESIYTYSISESVTPQVAKSRFSNLVGFIKDMETKGWSIIDAIKHSELNIRLSVLANMLIRLLDGCIDGDRITFTSVDRVRPLDMVGRFSNGRVYDIEIEKMNNRLWYCLAIFYRKIEPSLQFKDAVKHVRKEYKDLAIPTIHPPFYYRYSSENDQSFRDPINYWTPSTNRQASSSRNNGN
ncbi:hypothetical protein BDF19DRAFT_426383 [Syncephalis fuscata]|nr:hypothetical protein BDF19DRAFT_426383 [Syncephalis fuscata]